MTKPNAAIIIGALGQDGSYLYNLLDKKGTYDLYPVVRFGTGNDQRAERLKYLAFDYVSLISVDISGGNFLFKTIENILKKDPSKRIEIYNFSGESNVFMPYEIPQYTIKSIVDIPATILRVMAEFKKLQPDADIRFFQASSSLVFGRSKTKIQNEQTPRDPLYVYGHAKNMVDGLINEYRLQFGIYACSGIFYNHESPRRGDKFFTKKIARKVAEIISGKCPPEIRMSNLDSVRDIGHAMDYVNAAYLMLQSPTPKDYIIGSGMQITLRSFIETCLHLDKGKVEIIDEPDNNPDRVNVNHLLSNPSLIQSDLKWTREYGLFQIAQQMVEHELKTLK